VIFISSNTSKRGTKLGKYEIIGRINKKKKKGKKGEIKDKKVAWRV
jgi:hypothetical protein